VAKGCCCRGRSHEGCPSTGFDSPAHGLDRESQQPSEPQRCLLELERPLLREGTRIEVTPGVVNFFGGGDARFRCRNQNVRMRSDSVASYQGTVVQFVGNVRYADSTIEMTADFGTYFRENEKWEARGNVILTNLKDGSTLKGPSPGLLPVGERDEGHGGDVRRPAADDHDAGQGFGYRENDGALRDRGRPGADAGE
jgi:hypothetical protein